MHRLYRAAIVGIVDRLFPPQCAACNAIGSGLCALCVPRDAPAATRLLPGLSVRALGEYRGALRRAVLALKDGRRDVAAELGARLAPLVPPGALLIPVPTTRARKRVRGIDGVVEIARVAARLSGASLACALEHGGWDTQRGRDRRERLAARGRFHCREPALAGRRAMLVDDVCTTGATLVDCAAELRRAGVHVSQALAVAVANGKA